MRTVSLGLLGAARADPTAAAELIRKCRLFIVVLALTLGTTIRQPGRCRKRVVSEICVEAPFRLELSPCDGPTAEYFGE
jgi:hypothetical protein